MASITTRAFPQQGTPPFPSMARSCMGGITAPQHLPFQFSDNTIIHVVVRVHQSQSSSSPSSPPSKFYKLKTRFLHNSQENIKVVRMPRSEYLRHFKRDKAGNYVGTEEERSWTGGELDERYGKYWEWGNPRWVLSESEKGGRVMVAEGEGV